MKTTVPSLEHAHNRIPQADQLTSKTEWVNISWITTKGLFKLVLHIERDLSRDPIATQQNNELFSEVLVCKIFPLNL